jgi:hypothetical protein
MFVIGLTKRLPIIPVPLRQGEPELTLDLQELHDQCGERGAYLEDTDFALDPVITASTEERTWLDGRLKEEGRRAR